MKTEKFLSKPLCIGLLACAFVYGLILPFCWGNDPTHEYGTLSILCENHRIWFWLWGLLSSGSMVLNTQYMYKKFSYKNRFLDALCILSFIGIIAVALTIASIALFFIINIKKFKGFGILTACVFGILATFLVIFIGFGKSALMEMIPLAMIEILIFIVNFTPFVKVKPIKEN